MAEPSESDTTQPLHRRLGMTDDELAAVVDELGREPTDLELAMYSVMWSEHCSYKSSRAFLSRFPTEAPWVLVGPGEGAGVVEVMGVGLRLLHTDDVAAGFRDPIEKPFAAHGADSIYVP